MDKRLREAVGRDAEIEELRKDRRDITDMADTFEAQRDKAVALLREWLEAWQRNEIEPNYSGGDFDFDNRTKDFLSRYDEAKDPDLLDVLHREADEREGAGESPKENESQEPPSAPAPDMALPEPYPKGLLDDIEIEDIGECRKLDAVVFKLIGHIQAQDEIILWQGKHISDLEEVEARSKYVEDCYQKAMSERDNLQQQITELKPYATRWISFMSCCTVDKFYELLQRSQRRAESRAGSVAGGV